MCEGSCLLVDYNADVLQAKYRIKINEQSINEKNFEKIEEESKRVKLIK
jgi:hypothetical protein